MYIFTQPTYVYLPTHVYLPTCWLWVAEVEGGRGCGQQRLRVAEVQGLGSSGRTVCNVLGPLLFAWKHENMYMWDQ